MTTSSTLGGFRGLRSGARWTVEEFDARVDDRETPLLGVGEVIIIDNYTGPPDIQIRPEPQPRIFKLDL